MSLFLLNSEEIKLTLLISFKNMPLLIVISGIILLFILIAAFKLNAFISFIIVCLLVGILQGMELLSVIQSIQNGIGNTLGFLVMILGFGAMLGKLVADSGAAQRITSTLVSRFGLKYIQWALVLAGFIVGIPMFYSVGFVILVPLVFTVAASTGLPLIYVGLPMLSSLSVTHGFLPPHPAPTAIAEMFKADIGKTLLYGIIIAIPTIIVAGPLFSRTIKNITATPLKEFYNPIILKDHEMPKTGISIFTALLPVILIIIATLASNFLSDDFMLKKVIVFIGNPVIAMLISVLVAIYTLGLARGKKMKEVMDSLAKSISSITMVLLIIAGAGALKQILIDSGVSDYIGALLNGSNISPLILAWLIATIIRVCVGSATVAGLTAAGIVLPLVAGTGVSAELMVLAIGAGSLMFSHVNDGGFWLYKEYFNLSVKDTLKTWTVMETTVGTMGLIGVLIMNAII
jgi:Gnt-I system high-affinity gluconate transporter